MTPTNWPDPERPGEPMFPERDGGHAIQVPDFEESEIVYYWHQNGGGWTEYNHQGAEDFLTDEDMQGWIYKGPVLTPAQINEMLAAERERCEGKIRDILAVAMSRFELNTILETLEELRPKNVRSDWTEYAQIRSDLVDEAQALFQEIRNLGAAP